MLNVNATSIADREAGRTVSAVNCCFACQDGSAFKAQVPFSPYMYLVVAPGREGEVDAYLRRRHGPAVRSTEAVRREDLDLRNHLSGLKRTLLKVSFWLQTGLQDVRRDMLQAARRNKARAARGHGADGAGGGGGGGGGGAGGPGRPGAGRPGTGPPGLVPAAPSGDSALIAAALGGGEDEEGGKGGGPPRGSAAAPSTGDALSAVLDVREHDVPYHVRFLIDAGVRCGHWYRVRARGGSVALTPRPDLLARAEVRVCAFDIETTKLPLQFPNAAYDQVFMISYMLDKAGFLIVNREVVAEDVSDFEYSPKPEFAGPFTVINVPDERALIRHFFDHMRAARPGVYVTYNGDWFDFPFLAARAAVHGLDLGDEIGFKAVSRGTANGFADRGGGPGTAEAANANANASVPAPSGGDGSAPPDSTSATASVAAVGGGGEWLSRTAVHMDCLHWVNRDSYLPQGSRGLKAVTKAKLGYDPVEVDPEDMLRYAAEQPQAMAAYSVSDAVSTYYLYMTYIHPFIFSLATIIPMPPDEVLRKGSGTLCELLLMVRAYEASVVAPNKHQAPAEASFRGRPLEAETYIGGKVEALESGVFRADLPTRFACDPAAYQGLLDSLDADLAYALETDAKTPLATVTNFAEVKAIVAATLGALRDAPVREEPPLIYHLDVAAMYPNIILTNRLQPSAIVTDEDCAACDFNRPGKTCLRPMEWVWRGETFTASMAEYRSLKAQLEAETFAPPPGSAPGAPGRPFYALPPEERARMLKDRLKAYCQRVYKRVLDKPVAEVRTAGVCMRENDFYVGTVRAFRDRRYEYKALNKTWKGKLDGARAGGDALGAAAAADMVVLYDSLQLAHKCILNSFYGYVMRRGARWYSMEMAGVVTYTGAQIIQRANALITKLGVPLELDTDGIWCCLPGSFPEDLEFMVAGSPKPVRVSYPCAVLNVMVARHNTNNQYASLVEKVDGAGRTVRTYETSAQMSIEFEVDGPYRAMILPASKEEGRLIKKRYAVFNHDGSLAELKGFELKRRGELKLVKAFQAEVFSKFLEGATLAACYAAVGGVADRWLDLLDTQGAGLPDEELISYISEATVMSKALPEYEGRKSCALTTARRLAQFLGDGRIRDKGLVCNYIVSARPLGAPTSERAVPVAVFATEPAVARAYLRRWCGEFADGRDPSEPPDVRAVVDWAYYKERLAGTIQKIVTIPAAMQRLPNPVPRVRHPDWLHKRVREKDAKVKQRRLDGFVTATARGGGGDLEDLATPGRGGRARPATARPHTDGAGALVATPTPRRVGGGGAGPPKAAAPARPRSPSPPLPDARADPAGWVAAQKRRWRAAVAGRKKARAAAVAEAAAVEAGGGPALAAPAAPTGALGALLARAGAAATAPDAHWQLLALERAPPGDAAVGAPVRGWALVGGALHSLRLAVPRTFYIASTDPPGSPALAALGAVPARGREPPFGAARLAGEGAALYAVSLDPGSPAAVAGPSALDAALAAPHVRGVWERDLAPEALASLTLGCVASVAPGPASRSAAARALQAGTPLDLRCLVMRTAAECDYLPGLGSDTMADDGAPPLRHLAVYARADPARGRAVLAAHCPAAGRAVVVLVSPLFEAGGEGGGRAAAAAARAARDVTPALVERAWRETATADGGGAMAAPAVTVLYAPDEAAGARLAQRALVEWREAHRGPALVVVDAPAGPSGLARALPVLRTLPCADAGPSPAAVAAAAAAAARGGPAAAAALAAGGGDAGAAALAAALAWQAPSARAAAAALAGARTWLGAAADRARYAHLPLASLGRDWRSATADAQLARTAHDAGVLLWGSPVGGGGGALTCALSSGVPDAGALPTCGGSADAEAAAGAAEADAITARGGTPGATGDVLVPGAYRCVCVQVAVNHLTVAALVAAPALADADGGPADGGGGAAMRCLRRLVQAWVSDATQHGSAYADELLTGLGRWLRSGPARPGGSGLHAPALAAAAGSLSRRLLAALLSDMARLGARVVAADEASVILATGRAGLAPALAHADYLLSALSRRSGGLFNLLALSPQRWWHSLLFRDRWNYAGVRAGLPAEVAGLLAVPGQVTGGGPAAAAALASAATAATASALETTDIEALWTIQAYLPPLAQAMFAAAVTEFLYQPWKNVAAGGGGGGLEECENETPPPSPWAANPADDPDAPAPTPPVVGGVATQAACAAAGTASAAAGEGAQAAWLRKHMATTLGRRLLRFVYDARATMCSDDGDPTHAFPVLAGSHLSEQELGTPALALTRAICEALALDRAVADEVATLRRNMLREAAAREFSSSAAFIDPCDTFVLRSVPCGACGGAADLDLARDPALQAHRWACATCAAPIDTGDVEARLLACVSAAGRAHATQDLRCCKCGACAKGRLSSNCDRCGSALELTRPAGVTARDLRTLRRVARWQGFDLLDDATSWMLQDLPE